MMTLLIKRIRNFSFHFFLILIFFLANGYSEHIGLIPFQDIILFFLLIASGGTTLYFLFSYFFRNRLKGGLFTTVLAGVWLFYGVLQDTLRSTSIFHKLSAHRFLVPIILTILIFFYTWLKKSTKVLQRTTLYVNSLLSVFIVFDLAKITLRFIQKQERTTIASTKSEIINCTGCTKPNIYFVVLDEYCGSRVLKEYFQYDNSSFENFLRINRFFVPANSASNYSLTSFSMASTFDMNYLRWDKHRNELQAYAQAAKSIPVSSSIKFLESLGYSFHNYSIFDLADKPSVFQTGFLPLKLKLITAKTLPERIKRDFFWRIEVRNKGTGALLKWITRSIHHGNEKMISLTRNHSEHGTTQASFVYTHLMMPHAPYAFDSTGVRSSFNYNDASVPEEKKKAGYLQYLVYTNKRVKDLVETILKNTKRKAVIILLSDHGYRDRITHNGCRDLNNNFNAVFLPDSNYANYYDSISNVNQFRVLFKTLFSPQFPKLKDSCLL